MRREMPMKSEGAERIHRFAYFNVCIYQKVIQKERFWWSV